MSKNTTMLQQGKRYWFFTGDHICSGLYDGETIGKNGDMIVLYGKRSEFVWSIPIEDVYATKKEAVDSHRGCRVFE